MTSNGRGVSTPVISVSQVRRLIESDRNRGTGTPSDRLTILQAENGLFFGRNLGVDSSGLVVNFQILGLIVTDEGVPIESWPPESGQ